MTPEALADLHARVFIDTPRPWTAGEFAELSALPSTQLVAAAPAGFALGQFAGPEATLLTLAVHPERRRRGLGRALLRELEDRARDEGVEEMFLEVAANNAAALALYAGLDYRRAGVRPRYYFRAPLPPIDALVLRKNLGPARSALIGKSRLTSLAP